MTESTKELSDIILHCDPIIKLAFVPEKIVSEMLATETYFIRPKQTGDNKWRRPEPLYLLEDEVDDLRVQIEQITGADAVHVLVDQTYHFNFRAPHVETVSGTKHIAQCGTHASAMSCTSAWLPYTAINQ
jgi:hypothetical protein